MCVIYKKSLNIPIVVIGVKGLPRGALVEVEVIGVSENFSKCPVMFKEDFTNSLSHTIELEGTGFHQNEIYFLLLFFFA